jgi:hypothetical protein
MMKHEANLNRMFSLRYDAENLHGDVKINSANRKNQRTSGKSDIIIKKLFYHPYQRKFFYFFLYRHTAEADAPLHPRVRTHVHTRATCLHPTHCPNAELSQISLFATPWNASVCCEMLQCKSQRINLINEMFSENLRQVWEYYIFNGSYNIKQMEGNTWLALSYHKMI